MKKTACLLTLLFFVGLVAHAQEVKFGKIPDELLSQTAHPDFPDAPAAIIYKEQRVSFDYLQSTGWEVITYTHVRLKVYNKNGLDDANFKIPLYFDGGDVERLSKYKGYTYNLENGKVIEDKLKKESVFETELNDFLKQVTITMPNVKEGSVIELEYTVNSPFIFNINEFKFQYDIPVDYMTADFQSPEYFIFKRHVKGYYPINFNEVSREQIFALYITRSNENRGMIVNSFKSNSSTSYENVRVRMSGYTMKAAKVPPLTDESYVNNIENYRSSVKFELNATKSPSGKFESYTQTWEKVAETIYKSESFGGQLSKSGYFSDDLAAINAQSNDPMQRAVMIYGFVQSKMNWNGYTGVYARQSLNKAYKENTGNAAEINLMLTAMLREAGLQANPVLVSTRNHGISMFPTREGFNYVISAIETDKGYILLDATDKFCEPNLLPERALNWNGILLRKDNSITQINLTSPRPAQKNYMLMAKLHENGDIDGKLRITHMNHFALRHRQKYFGANPEEYLSELESSLNDMEISEYKADNLEEKGKSVQESFSFKLSGAVEQIGEKLYVNPLLFASLTENPFKLDQRDYPVDFIYPQQHKYTFTLQLPEGYTIESLPESQAMTLPNEYGSFKYQISQVQNSMQLLVNLDINSSIIPNTVYPDLKAFFAQLIQKENEKVVLAKL